MVVKKACQQIEKPVVKNMEEVRRLELERLDEWQLKVERGMKGSKDLSAVDRGLKIMDCYARLLGLGPPEKSAYGRYGIPEWDRKAIEEMTTEELMKKLCARAAYGDDGLQSVPSGRMKAVARIQRGSCVNRPSSPS